MIVLRTETFYTRQEAAAMFGIKAQSLAAYACASHGRTGPRFHRRGTGKRGRVYYSERDLLDWFQRATFTGSAQ